MGKKKQRAEDIALGTASVGVGAGVLGSVKRKGEISGKVHLYHRTPTKNVGSIMEGGLLGSKALDPEAATNIAMNGRGAKDGRKLVYLGKNKLPTIGMKGYYDRNKINSSLLKVNIPYEDLKKMKSTDQNPEFYNARSGKEYVEKLIQNEPERYKAHPTDPSKMYEATEWTVDRETGKLKPVEWKEVSKKKVAKKTNTYRKIFDGGKNSDTKIIEGDIDSKYIKGSKNYVKTSAKDVAKYIKNNPGRFAKGVAKGTAAAGMIAGGSYLAVKGRKRKDRN